MTKKNSFWVPPSNWTRRQRVMRSAKVTVKTSNKETQGKEEESGTSGCLLHPRLRWSFRDLSATTSTLMVPNAETVAFGFHRNGNLKVAVDGWCWPPNEG